MYGQHPLRVRHLLNTVLRSFSFRREGGRSKLSICSYFHCCFPYLHATCFSRDEELLDNLLSHAICTDFALKTMIGKAELLIFTSLHLPGNIHSESKTNYTYRIMLFFFFFFCRVTLSFLKFIPPRVLLNMQDSRENFISGEFSGDIKLLLLTNQIIMSIFKPLERGRVYLQIQGIIGALRGKGVQ